MNLGAENQKKTIIAGTLLSFALLYGGYQVYTNFFADSTTPPPSIAPVAQTTTVKAGINAPLEAPAAPGPASSAAGTGGSAALITPTGNSAGVATRVASSSASLDPSLDETAMLRTEALAYSGSGRNIFSAIYVPPVVVPKAIAPARKLPPAPYVPPPPPPPPPTCPPTCPPINLKFFGTETTANGARQAFLLQGDDVFLAAAGDIVARSYKIVSISANSVQVEDLVNKNTQTLPLQSN